MLTYRWNWLRRKLCFARVPYVEGVALFELKRRRGTISVREVRSLRTPPAPALTKGQMGRRFAPLGGSVRRRIAAIAQLTSVPVARLRKQLGLASPRC